MTERAFEHFAEEFTAVYSWLLNTQEQAMNAFCGHHYDSIKFGYRCFDRFLLNGLIQPIQQAERVIGFFNAYRDGERVTRQRFRDIDERVREHSQRRPSATATKSAEALPAVHEFPRFQIKDQRIGDPWTIQPNPSS